jgi:hypothetical protein
MKRRLRPLSTCLLLGLLSACNGDASGPSADDNSLLVSDPGAPSFPVAASTRSALSVHSIDVPTAAWVSLPSGTVPDGATAEIRNTTSGAIVTAELTDGGLDPVAVVASAGDTIAVTVVDNAGRPLLMRATVPLRRPPIVIRTRPARGKTDVPLNARIVALFSEPMDRGSLTPDQISVMQGEQVVPGQVVVWPDGYTVEFIPSHELSPSSTYRLIIRGGVTDATGEAAGATEELEFTTGLAAAQPAGIVVRPAMAERQPGEFVHLTASPVDSAGNLITGDLPTWQSSDTAVARLDESDPQPDALARLRAPGTAMITATAGGQSGTATITVTRLSFTSFAVGTGPYCGATVGRTYCQGSLIDNVPGGSIGYVNLPGPIGLAAAAQSISIGKSDRSACYNELGMDLDCSYSCAISAGAAYCWHQATWNAHPIVARSSFVAVGAGKRHACAVTSRAAVECWGAFDGSSGRLEFSPDGGRSVPIPGLSRIVKLAAGSDHDCAADAAGSLWCWGENAQGQLGRHDRRPQTAPTLLQRVSLPAVVAISAGTYHTCAVVEGGDAYCWGRNDLGQLGSGRDQDETAPALVAGGHRWRSITAGTRHTCAVDSAGVGYCWGDNRRAQLGSLPTTGSPTPIPIRTALRFESLYAGDGQTCGLAVERIAYCWGVQDSSIDPNVAPYATPREVEFQR